MTSIMTFVIDATDSSCTGVNNFTGSSLKEMTCVAVAFPLTTHPIAMQSPIGIFIDSVWAFVFSSNFVRSDVMKTSVFEK